MANEIQTITFTGTPSSGTFTVAFGGQTTSAIAYDADAATLESALQSLSSIGSGNVDVTGSAGAWTIEFTGSLGHADQALLFVDDTSVLGDDWEEVEIYVGNYAPYPSPPNEDSDPWNDGVFYRHDCTTGGTGTYSDVQYECHVRVKINSTYVSNWKAQDNGYNSGHLTTSDAFGGAFALNRYDVYGTDKESVITPLWYDETTTPTLLTGGVTLYVRRTATVAVTQEGSPAPSSGPAVFHNHYQNMGIV